MYRALLLNRNCADTVSAVTHTSAVDKQVGEFTFNLASPAELDLEVTFLLTKTSGWFYSKYALEVVGDSGPTSSPTTSPIASPTVSSVCVDSPLTMYVNKRERVCAWAAKNPSKRCNKNGVPEHCPLTCDAEKQSCSTCVDSKRKFIMKESGIIKRCGYIRKNMSRCAKEGVPETCRLTCGHCQAGVV